MLSCVVADEVFLTDDTVHTGDLEQLTSYLDTGD